MEELLCRIENIVFQNKQNGYMVCAVTTSDFETTAVGVMSDVRVGENVKLSGQWIVHPQYGEQFEVVLYEKELPKTIDGIISYLGSGLIKGVGAVTAKRIVDKFGEDTLKVIECEHQKLARINGISIAKAKLIHNSYMSLLGVQQVVQILQPWGISAKTASKLYNLIGENCTNFIKQEPYKALSMADIRFDLIDSFALAQGFLREDYQRVLSGVIHTLKIAAGQRGHTCLPFNELLAEASKLLGLERATCEDVLQKSFESKDLFLEGDNVYLPLYHDAETNCARHLHSLEKLGKRKSNLTREMIEKQAKLNDIELSEQQIQACLLALERNVVIITGGPGTGKTTVINIIIQLLEKEHMEIALAAPTGIAAKRMAELSSREAKTLHRLLEIGYSGDDDMLNFARNEALPLDEDVVIIDELSMVDVLLFSSLLKALKPGTKLILMGDADQLPSVGAGRVLEALLESGLFKGVIRLTEIYRQASESMIVVNAHRINNGEMPLLNEKTGDFYFVSRPQIQSCLNTLIYCAKVRLPEQYGLDPKSDIQVLSPSHKGELGVANLNKCLQEALNPLKPQMPQVQSINTSFRIGDKVMQIKNNYEARWEIDDERGVGIFNGDIGIIEQISPPEETLVIKFNDGRRAEYDFSRVDELTLAYCITVHKSQGSEFPCVLMPCMPYASALMARNLFYTAVTRARRMVVLFGSEDCVWHMVKNNRKSERHFGLSDKLKLLRNC